MYMIVTNKLFQQQFQISSIRNHKTKPIKCVRNIKKNTNEDYFRIKNT